MVVGIAPVYVENSTYIRSSIWGVEITAIIFIGAVTISCSVLYLMIILIRNIVLSKYQARLIDIIKYSDDDQYMNKLLQKYKRHK